MNKLDRRISMAPMMNWTAEHDSVFQLSNFRPSDIAWRLYVSSNARRAGKPSFAKATSGGLMLHSMVMRARTAVALVFMSVTAWGAVSDGPPSAPGSKLYEQFCGSCHDHPQGRIPARDVIARRSPEEVMQAMTNGVMRAQAAGLNMNDRVAVATFVTGQAPADKMTAVPEGNLCVSHGNAAISAGSSWNGWGRDLDNSRYQPEPGLIAANVPHLKVKWAFGYRATYIYGQPTVVDGRVYVTNSSGRVYALDARTGCTYWTFDASAAVRTAVSIIGIHGRFWCAACCSVRGRFSDRVRA